MDEDMDAGSPYDPLFDDADGDGDAEAEVEAATGALPSSNGTILKTTPPPSSGLALPGSGLKLPGSGPGPSMTTAPTTTGENTTTSSTPTPLFQQPSTQAGPSRAGAARGIPLLTKTSYQAFSNDIMMASTMDGQVTLLDRRVPSSSSEGAGGVGRLKGGEKTPPWCMSACWSGDGNQILAGRRNGTLDIWDLRRTSSSTAPNLLRTLKTPQESGSISCVVAFPDGRHIAT
jgi:transcriptional activator SPT8